MVKGKKHLSPVERVQVEASLKAGKSVKQIARDLGRSASTVAREIRKRSVRSDKGTSFRPNQCARQKECGERGVCAGGCVAARELRCALCTHVGCNKVCPRFEPVRCAVRESRPGRVCNGCARERSCQLTKLYYVAAAAEKGYRKTLSESRQGAAIEEGELRRIDPVVTRGILSGQSLHHIFVTRPGFFTQDERTLSRYLHDGLFTAKRGDMKRSCMVRPRKALAKEYQHKVEKGCYVGRTYRDYEAFLDDNPGTETVLMDLVIGRPGGKCLLTLHFPAPAFMLAVLIPDKCAESVAGAFDALYARLGHDEFARLFPVVLTDRGTEFSNPSRLEFAAAGGGGEPARRCRVFFCDPMNSNQKSRIERNHEILREILPKGVSFDGLGQEDVDKAVAHVNAYVRQSQSDRTPREVFDFLYGEGTADRLGVARVDPADVCLKPRLLGIKMK